MEPIDKNRILDQISSNEYLPSLSPLIIQLINVAADEHSSILHLSRIIEQDPGLTTRLLKLVNSAFYAHREPITSISYAVMVAGFNKIRSMALSISLKDTFPLGKVNGMDYDYFWKTSLYRAILAQDLTIGSYLSNLLDPEEAFTTALILELGLLLLFHVCPDALKDDFPGGDVPLEEAIEWADENLGINHRELGKLTLKRWNFPEQFLDAQKYYGPRALKEDSPELFKITEIARVCTQLFLGSRDDFAFLKKISDVLNMELERLSEILTEVFFKVEDMARELRLQVNPNADILEVMEKANQTLIKINGSLEENLGKIVRLAATQDREAGPSVQAIPEEQRKELETAMDAVAHEIRNPLMVIGGFAQRLIKKGHEQVEVVQYAELIAQESRRLEKVLNDLLASTSSTRPSKKD